MMRLKRMEQDAEGMTDARPTLVDVEGAIQAVLIGYSRVTIERLSSEQVMFGGEWKAKWNLFE